MMGESKNEGVFLIYISTRSVQKIAPEWDYGEDVCPAPTPVSRYATSCVFTMRAKGSIVYNNELGVPSIVETTGQTGGEGVVRKMHQEQAKL